mmetsp:Transcript_19624/g.32932  ORF Transcript_19624/g.32932 Transcript_19624/m.32932 type:complete len:201 (+) Transcript_19624:99-701(+)
MLEGQESPERLEKSVGGSAHQFRARGVQVGRHRGSSQELGRSDPRGDGGQRFGCDGQIHLAQGHQALHAATLALCRVVGVLVGRVAPGCWLGATRPTCRGGHLPTVAKPLDGCDELGGAPAVDRLLSGPGCRGGILQQRAQGLGEGLRLGPGGAEHPGRLPAPASCGTGESLLLLEAILAGPGTALLGAGSSGAASMLQQ